MKWDLGLPGNTGNVDDMDRVRSSGFTNQSSFCSIWKLWRVKYLQSKNRIVPTAYVLLNSDLGSDQNIVDEVKNSLSKDPVKFEVQGVYGVYDIVLKITSDNPDELRTIITNKIRKIPKIQSTLTMMVIEEQE